MAENISLSKKVGPLPVGVWLAVVLGGLAIGYYMNRSQSKQDTVIPEQDPGVGRGGSGFDVVNPPPPEKPAQETNMTWAFKAINWLITQLHPPTTAANAINKYIYGMDLSVEENALVNLALKQFGAPPEPLPPTKVPDIPKDPPKNPPKDEAPPPVRDLRGESPTPNSVLLLWAPSPGATHYQIDGREGAWHGRVTHDTSEVIWWLEAGRNYTFRVRAGKGTAYSEWREVSVSVRGGGEYVPGPQGERKHIVQSGDTLFDIAARYYGNGRRRNELYASNQGVIEATARSRGLASSEKGNRLFVGTILVIP